MLGPLWNFHQRFGPLIESVDKWMCWSFATLALTLWIPSVKVFMKPISQICGISQSEYQHLFSSMWFSRLWLQVNELMTAWVLDQVLIIRRGVVVVVVSLASADWWWRKLSPHTRLMVSSPALHVLNYSQPSALKGPVTFPFYWVRYKHLNTASLVDWLLVRFLAILKPFVECGWMTWRNRLEYGSLKRTANNRAAWKVNKQLREMGASFWKEDALLLKTYEWKPF